ncbi:MAG: hypothetical protein Kow00109_07670 [Acidobacteriota bacterium]
MVLTVWFLCLLGAFGSLRAAQPPSPIELQELAKRAQQAFESGDFTRAARDYEDLTRLLPDVPGLQMNLGLARYLGGDPAGAIEPLRRATAGDPTLTPAWLFLGAALLDSGQPAEAVQPLREYLERQPSEGEAWTMLAEAYRLTGRWSEAIPAFRRALAADEQNSRAWYGLGKTYETAAGVLFERLDRVAPESAYWLALIGESRLARRQLSSAFFFFRKALEKKPDLRGVHSGLAAVYEMQNHPDWAATETAREEALGPADCTRNQPYCRWRDGACDHLLAESAESQDPEVIFWAVRCANQEAAEAFRRLEALPPSPELHRFRAELERARDRHWESIRHWEEALKLSPDDPTLRQELAFSYYLNRNYAQAQALVDELLQSNPDSPELNFLAGDCRLNLQRVEEAVPFLEKAVRIDPTLLSAHAALGRAYLDLDRPGDALPHLEKALPQDSDGSIHFQAAQAYRRLGRLEEARQALTRYQDIKRRVAEADARLEEEAQITPP